MLKKSFLLFLYSILKFLHPNNLNKTYVCLQHNSKLEVNVVSSFFFVIKVFDLQLYNILF